MVNEKIDKKSPQNKVLGYLCCLKKKEFSNMVNDTISDMLTRIRNANVARKPSVSILKTKVHERICQILEREGFIEKYYVSDTQSNELVIDLNENDHLYIIYSELDMGGYEFFSEITDTEGLHEILSDDEDDFEDIE